MFGKLLKIKNYGRFKNFTKNDSDWDGTFRKVNVIYAPNGMGKTSLAVIFRSIIDEDYLIEKKHAFDINEPVEIAFMVDNKELKYNGKKWNKHIQTIEVFDSFYFEDNVYVISFKDSLGKLNYFEQFTPKEIEEIKKEIRDSKESISKLCTKKINRKNAIRKGGGTSQDYKKDSVLENIKKEQNELNIKIEKLQIELNKQTRDNRLKYIEIVNKYLAVFCDDISISENRAIRDSGNNYMRIVYDIKIRGHVVTNEERSQMSLKYCLCDGDKNALALSFFLAKIDMLPNKKDYVVVIDDPFTSFDTQRKATTINQLNKMSMHVGQLFLLTHDLYFAKDYNTVSCEEILNLKITNHKESSIFTIHNIQRETLTGYNKDIMTLRDYITGVYPDDQLHLREVVRCIRPSLEGIFRLKYFNYVNDNQWLGDFIRIIKDNNTIEPFKRLQSIVDEIEDINDYSKIYHHSNPVYMEVNINPIELKTYVRRTLKVIELI